MKRAAMADNRGGAAIGRALVLLACVILGLAAQIESASAAGRRVALVIGNSRYVSTQPLLNPANDSEDVANALRAVGFEVIHRVDLSKRDMDYAMAEFARRAKGTEAALFYYAGHGMQYQGRNYITPTDAALDDEISLRYQMTSVDDVRDAVDQSSGVKIIVLDACRDNPLAQKFAAAQRNGPRAYSSTRGLARIDQVSGMMVVYATQANDVALDGAQRNSPFSRAFVKELQEPGLEIGAMFRRVQAAVYKETNGRQIPEVSSSLFIDQEYYLNQSETDRTVWERIRSSNQPEALNQFLKRYPDSFFAPDAHVRLDALKNAEAARAAEEERRRIAADAAQRDAERRAAEAAAAKLRDEAKQRDEAAAAAKAADATAKVEAERLAAAEAARAEAARLAAQQEALKAEAARQQEKQVVAALDPKVATATESATLLAAPIIDQLRRLGCYAGQETQWTAPSVRRGLESYVKSAKLGVTPELPSNALLDDLKARTGRLCPLVCGVRQIERDGRCVAKTCARGEMLDADGDCVVRPVAKPRKAPAKEPVVAQPRRSKPAPPVAERRAPKPVASAPAGSARGGRCFNFNGRSYCE